MAPEGGVKEMEIEFVVVPDTLSSEGADNVVYPVRVSASEFPFVLVATRLKLYDIPLVKPLRTYVETFPAISTFVVEPPVVGV